MTLLPSLASGKIWTHKTVLWQDIANSHTDFTSVAFYQDFTLFGLPANHIILGVKIAMLESFDVGIGNSALLYVANPSVMISNPSSTYVTDVADCYGYAALTVPQGSDQSYEYGTFRWFTLSTPGSNVNVSPAYCTPKRMDAHDVVARVVIDGSVHVEAILSGIVEITVQYTRI